MAEHTKPLLRLTEFGAAEAVPGSKLLLEAGEKKHLIDYGKSYNDKEEEVTGPLKSIDSLILSHAHADHIGDVLKLYKSGFNNKVFSTYETAAITELQLKQEVSSVFIHNKMVKGKRYTYGPNKGKWVPFKKVLYNSEDINNFMSLFSSASYNKKGHPYEKTITLNDSVNLTFYEAGHIPGSSQMLFEIKKEGKEANVLIACDLGRTDYQILGHPRADTPIVKFPKTGFSKNIDYIVVESTYGDKTHAPLEDSLSVLENAAKDAAKNNGRLVIPAFSIMRTHMLWNFLFRLHQQGRLPEDMTFYSSSPFADQVSKIILSHIENLDEQALKEFENKNYNPFHFEKLVHHKKMDETRAVLEDYTRPSGFIASSGMCEGGRVIPILEKVVPDPNSIILLTGYASPKTRAGKLQNKEKQIPFDGSLIELKADVRKLGGLSGHADREEIIAHLKSMHDPAKGEQFKGIFIKHGEKEACYKLKDKIVEAGFKADTVHVMKKDQAYNI